MYTATLRLVICAKIAGLQNVQEKVETLRRLSFQCVALIWVTVTCSQAWAFRDGAWLYVAEVPVPDKTAESRTLAAETGILQVLSRLSGLRSVPRNEAVKAALANPDRYYSAFVYNERIEQRARVTRVELSFQRQLMLDLLEQAQLPLWEEIQPEVMAWVVVEDEGDRRVLSADDDSDLVAGLHQAAATLGVPVKLPVMDLEDQQQVTPSEVWGRMVERLQFAGERYNTDLVLVGRFRKNQDGSFSGDWQFWRDNLPEGRRVRNDDAASAALAGLEPVSTALTEAYAVYPRAQNWLNLSVEGLRGVADYASLLNHLGELVVLDEVMVNAWQPATTTGQARLELQLLSRAEPAQLLALLTQRGMLQQVSDQVSFDPVLLWQSQEEPAPSTESQPPPLANLQQNLRQ